MIPRLAKFSAPAPLHVAFLAELRARGFEGSLSPAYADRTVVRRPLHRLSREAAMTDRLQEEAPEYHRQAPAKCHHHRPDPDRPTSSMHRSPSRASST